MGWDPLGADSSPKPLQEGLNELLSELGAPTAHELQSIFQTWEEHAGRLIAAHATPSRLADGVLTVVVDDPIWATEMRFIGPELIDRINKRTGEQTIRRLQIRVRPA